jgi:hypothetical protein
MKKLLTVVILCILCVKPAFAAGSGKVQFNTKDHTVNLEDGSLLLEIAPSLKFMGKVRDKGQQVYDITAYGDLSLISTDITAAYNATVAAIASDGVVFIPAGDWTLLSPVTVTNKHITVRGAGRDITRIHIPNTFTTSGNGVFQFIGTTALPDTARRQYSVEDLSILFDQPDSPHIADMRHYPDAIYFDCTGLVSIKDVTIERAWNAVTNTMGTANLNASYRSGGGSFNGLWFSAFNRGINVDYTANCIAVDGVKGWIFGGTNNQNGAIAYNASYNIFVIGQADGLTISNSLFYNGNFIRNKGAANVAQGTVYVSNTVFDQTHGISINTGKTFFSNCWFISFDDAISGATSGVGFNLTGGQTYVANSLLGASPSNYSFCILAFDSAGESGRSPLLSVTNSSIEDSNTTHDVSMFHMTGSNGSVNHLILEGNSICRGNKDGGGDYGQPLLYVENGSAGATSTLDFTGNRIDPMGAGNSPLIQLANDGPHRVPRSSSELPAGWSLNYPNPFLLGISNWVPANGSSISMDASAGAPLTVANNASSVLTGVAFGGLLIVHAVTVTGDSAIYLCAGGGGSPVLVSQTASSFSNTLNNSGTVNIYNNSGALTLQNKQGNSIDFRIITLRTR